MNSGEFSKGGRRIWVLAAAALVMSACGKGESTTATKPSGAAPVPVVLTAAKGMALQRSVRITGSLAGLETATISNRVAGRITKVLVDRGERIKPRQTLLEIEPDRFRLAVEESQAALQQTLARLGLKDVPAEDFDVSKTAPVKRAQSDYDLAKEKLDRYRVLNQNPNKTIGDFEFMGVEAACKSAESTLENSRDEARALLAQARQMRVQVDLRQKDYTDSVIIAPDGSTPDSIVIDSYAVTERKVSPGEYVREGSPLFTLTADSILKLQARVAERYLGDVKKGATVQFKMEAYPNEAFEGRVAIIDPAVDPASRTFLIEALVDNGKYGNRLRPGSFVPGELLTKKEPGRVMVPAEAVTSFVGVTKLFKLDAKANPPKVRALDVATGQEEEVTDGSGGVTKWVEIIKGDVKAEDQVVVKGTAKLVDGSVVTVESGAERAPQTTAAKGSE
jgi:RND family efflux transporter MFP subunit